MTVFVINPNSTEAMTEAMVAAAKGAAPRIAFEGWTSHDGPPSIQGREDGALAEGPLLELVDKADRQEAEGIVIGCFDDTALREAAERAACPVIGIGQAAFHYCAVRHLNFSVVTTLSVSVPILQENINIYGLNGFLGRVRASEVPVLELESEPGIAAERVLAEAQAALAEDQISAVVLGCAGMVNLTQLLRTELPCVVVDPVEAAAGCMGWLLANNV